MTNLPIKGSEDRIVGVVRNGQIQIENTDGYIIKRVHFNPEYLEGIASTIALLMTEARDAGFRQGQQHVRRALGID